jgi:hypothetical protein
MKIRMRLGIAATLGLLVAIGSGLRAQAQIPPPGDVAANFMADAGLQQVRVPQQGTWAEIISATPRWLVIQNQAGQQFPISSDRVREFLVRWPTSVDQLTNNSMIEVTGPEAGSNTILADHVDVYEADAQNLVSPIAQSLIGNNRSLPTGTDAVLLNTYGTGYWLTPEEYNMPWRMHLVGYSVGINPLRVTGDGNKAYAIEPGAGGMTMTRVTRGTNAFAQRGDLVYLTVENLRERSLDVTQLVLFKRIPYGRFQP